MILTTAMINGHIVLTLNPYCIYFVLAVLVFSIPNEKVPAQYSVVSLWFHLFCLTHPCRSCRREGNPDHRSRNTSLKKISVELCSIRDLVLVLISWSMYNENLSDMGQVFHHSLFLLPCRYSMTCLCKADQFVSLNHQWEVQEVKADYVQRG